MLLKSCRCGKLIPQSVKMCEECEQRQQSRHMIYNNTRRDKRAAEFYVSKEWRAMRERIIEVYDNVDIYALYENIERACCHCGTVTQELSQETGRRTAFRPITGGQETGKNQPHRKEAIHENDRTGTSHQNPASEKNVSDKRAKRET